MNRNLKNTIVAVCLIATAASGVVSLGVGLWTLLDGSGTGALLGRSVVALMLLLLAALFFSLFAAGVTGRSIEEVGKAVTCLRQSKYTFVPKPRFPEELVNLANSVYELGTQIEEREREHKQRSLTEARELRQEALKRFGQGVVREIQKSLAGVLGYVEIAQRQPGVAGPLKNYLILMEQEARLGRETLERILRYVREDPLPLETLAVNDLLTEVSRSFGAEKDLVQVQLKTAKDLPPIRGDANSLKFVLGTLIGNAREAMLPKGGTLELSTNIDQNGWVMIMVKDTGAGIREEDQIRIFTPFYTTKGQQKGAGLNLAIAERIVHLHGGKLDFWSNLGIGTVFFVNLPAATGGNPPPPSDPESRQHRSP